MPFDPDAPLFYDPKRRLWAEPSPDQCPEGHPWPAGQSGNVTLGYRHCPVHGSHRTWECQHCGSVLARPAFTDECPTGSPYANSPF